MNAEQIFASFVGVMSILGILYGMLRNFKMDIIEKIEGSESRLGKRMDGLENKIDKLIDKVEDIDRRLCRLEGAFSARDFCGLKHHDVNKHAE